jgi:hypothetical protein
VMQEDTLYVEPVNDTLSE